MNDSDIFAVIFAGIWCLVGIVFTCVGWGLSRAFDRREERLRGRADGLVTEVVRRESGGAGSSSRTVNYYPIVDFSADGQPVSLEATSGGGRKRHYPGQLVQVLYDPDDPTCFRLEGDTTNRTLGRVFLAVGLGCIALGLIVGLAVHSCAAQLHFTRID